jgi:hypothetical protein
MKRRDFISGMGLIGLLGTSGCGTLIDAVGRSTKEYKSRIADTDSKLDKTINREGRIEYIRNGNTVLPVVHVYGTFYEMGYQQGRLLRKEIKENVEGMFEGIAAYAEENYKKPKKNGRKRFPLPHFIFKPIAKRVEDTALKDTFRKIEGFIPREYREEMVGLSDGSGVDLEKIKKVHAMPELAETSCSLISVFGEGTIDGKMYQVRVLDFAMFLGVQRHPTVTIYHPRYGNPFANVAWAGFTGVVSGMSDKVAVSEGGYGYPDKKEELPGISHPRPSETLSGMPMIFELKNVLRFADNVEQASGILKSVDRTSYYAFIVSDAKDSRGYISTKDFVSVFKPNEKNPFPILKNTLYGSYDSQKCYDSLKENHGKISPDVLMNDVIPKIAMPKNNLHNVVYDLERKKMWVSNAKGLDKACDQPYVELDLDDLLEK